MGMGIRPYFAALVACVVFVSFTHAQSGGGPTEGPQVTDGPVADFKCGLRPREKMEEEEELVRKLLTLLGGPARDRRIVNGDKAYRGQYPWQAGIGTKRAGPFRAWCGGTIIAERFVLTAAHCMFYGDDNQRETPERLMVSVGDYKMDDDHKTDEYHEVKAIYNHPLYNHYVTLGNDIALLELTEPVKFNNFVQPACLPRPGQIPTASHCSISGWGVLESGDESQPNKLMGAEVKIESQEACQKYLRETHGYLRYMADCALNGQLCAGHYGEVDSCQGDSGGPLVCEEDGGYTVFGVTSYGIGCGSDQHPGVYTTVASHLRFIADVMRHAEAKPEDSERQHVNNKRW